MKLRFSFVVVAFLLLLNAWWVDAATYTGNLPPGKSCGDGAICKGCSFDYNKFVAPPCVGGWTAGVYNGAETAMYVYSSQCPWCNCSHCPAIAPETCCGISLPPNVPPIWGMTVADCASVGCSACSVYDAGFDGGCNTECGANAVYCKIGSDCNCMDNPCGPDTAYNFQSCECDCTLNENNCGFLLGRANPETEMMVTCYYADVFGWDDTSWLYADDLGYIEPVSGMPGGKDDENKPMWKVKYNFNNEWMFDDPCYYLDWQEYCSILHIPEINALFDECMNGLSPEVCVSTAVWDIPSQSFQGVTDQCVEFTSVSTPEMTGAFQQSFKYVYPAYGLINDNDIGVLRQMIKLHYNDRSSWPSCSVYSHGYYINEVKNQWSGRGSMPTRNIERRGLRLTGRGGYEKHD